MESSEAIYFFGEHDAHGFLSNFYPCAIEDPQSGRCFSFSEHYFMYHKCLLFDPENLVLLDQIATAHSPPIAKRLGRSVAHYDETVWAQRRYSVMREALRLKFSQNEHLRVQLLRTQDKELVEASPFDRIWGVGFGPKQAARTPRELFGENLLGRCLMEVRAELRTTKP